MTYTLDQLKDNTNYVVFIEDEKQWYRLNETKMFYMTHSYYGPACYNLADHTYCSRSSKTDIGSYEDKDIVQFNQIIFNQMKKRILTKDNFKRIYDAATCQTWKDRMLKEFPQLLVKDEVEVSDELYKEAMSNASGTMKVLLEDIFGKEDNTIILADLKKGEAMIITDSLGYNNHIAIKSRRSTGEIWDLTDFIPWQNNEYFTNTIKGKRIKLNISYELLDK